MSFKKWGQFCALMASISFSATLVGCGSPASNSTSKPAETPAAEQPAEAGSTTGGAGAEVPEGGEEPKKEEPKKEAAGS